MSAEPRSWSPLWVELSGLPGYLASKVKGGGAWSLLKKIIELDCERNALPGTVEISINHLADRTGLSPEAARKLMGSMRKMKLLAFFLPDNDEEPALFRLVLPLATPLTVEEISERHPHMFSGIVGSCRYTAVPGEPEHDDIPVDRHLQETVDLYFDTVGLKMNAFILDELRILVDLFAMDDIRRAFRRAKQNEIRSLRWVVQELTRRGKSPEVTGAEKKNIT